MPLLQRFVWLPTQHNHFRNHWLRTVGSSKLANIKAVIASSRGHGHSSISIIKTTQVHLCESYLDQLVLAGYAFK
jgi:hypothetical protein